MQQTRKMTCPKEGWPNIISEGDTHGLINKDRIRVSACLSSRIPPEQLPRGERKHCSEETADQCRHIESARAQRFGADSMADRRTKNPLLNAWEQQHLCWGGVCFLLFLAPIALNGACD